PDTLVIVASPPAAPTPAPRGGTPDAGTAEDRARAAAERDEAAKRAAEEAAKAEEAKRAAEKKGKEDRVRKSFPWAACDFATRAESQAALSALWHGFPSHLKFTAHSCPSVSSRPPGRRRVS